MPIHIGTSTKNQQQIALGLTQMQKVYVGDKLVWQKILASVGGYGMLYNWFCTQQQPSVEYGCLYNFYAVTDSRNICSAGFHVPTKTDFQTLETYLGGSTVAGGKLKETGLIHWNTPNTGATNEVGFNARGGGRRVSSFDQTKLQTWLWASTLTSSLYPDFLRLQYNTQTTDISFVNGKYIGKSIRPVKDSTTLTHGQTGTYVDPSGIIYQTMCIGSQEWVSCNIMTKHYRNGDAIPEVTDNTAWAALTTGARCSYNNTESNAGTTKKLSSSDVFDISTESQQTALQTYLGGFDYSGGKIKEAGTVHWNAPNVGATNEYGFTAVGSGTRNSSDGVFNSFKEIFFLWTKSQYNANEGYYTVIQSAYDYMYITSTQKQQGMSIRLCNPNTLNAEGSINSYTQNDGTVIPTIVINGVEWTMNLKETKWSDGADIQNITDNTAWSLLKSSACCDINNDITKR